MEDPALQQAMVDFSIFGYLGLRHTKDELRPWDHFSSGPPLSVKANPYSNALSDRVAALQGCESGILASSTLHLFWDFFTALSDEEVAIYVDAEAYPISQWGIECAIAKGVPVFPFPHQSPKVLNSLLSQNAPDRRRPIVVVDGVSSSTWSPAPLSDYLKSIEPFGGLLVIDDTQALGLLGHSPHRQDPFGLGGGGSLRWHEIEAPNVLFVSSFAKGFGVPIAVFTGSRQMVEWFRRNSKTLEHCSPPCIPLLYAVEHSLDVNELEGDELRARLAANIRSFQTILQEAGFSEPGPIFPIQSVDLPEGSNAVFLEKELQARGVRALFQQSGNDRARVVMGITAEHSPAEIEYAAGVLVETFGKLMRPK